MSQDYVYIVKLCSEDHHTDKWDVFVEKDEVGVFYDRKEANRAAIKALERWFEPRELIESRELYMDRRYGIAVMPHHVFSDRCEGSSFKIEILIKPVDAKGTSRGRAQGNSLETASRSARSTTRLTSLGPQSSNKKMTVKGTQLQVVKRLFYQVRDMRYLDYDATEEEGEPHIETFTYFSTKEAANNYVVSEAGYGDPDDRLDEMENVEQDDEGFADIEQELDSGTTRCLRASAVMLEVVERPGATAGKHIEVVQRIEIEDRPPSPLAMQASPSSSNRKLLSCLSLQSG